MIISIASGKGGTGKTTVSTNLAVSLERRVRLLDCDVEEPNAHLFLKPDIITSERVYTFVPLINKDRCSGCGMCADICQFNALTVISGQVLLFPELCHSCEGCLQICPDQAVGPGFRELGTLETGTRGPITFVQGCLRIGEPMSPPLIERVIKTAHPDETVIIDAPPGTSCPAISSMKHSDFVLLVTEPTPFGLHDLKLAVGAVRQMDIPCGLVINRSDLGDNKVTEYAHHENIPILMEIPFDRSIAETYSRGHILVETQPEWKKRFVSLFDSIISIIHKERVYQ